MDNSNNSRVDYAFQAYLQDRAQLMTVSSGSIAAGDALPSPKKGYDAGRIVDELIHRYLHCSTTTSGIFRF